MHPQCRCHAVTILKTEEEMAEDTKRILAGEKPKKGSVNAVKDVPAAFNKWIEDNRERAKGWSNMPYFVRDNIRYVTDFKVDTYSPAERKFTRAHRTKPAMAEMLNSWLQGKYPDMPTTEMAALYHYTRGDISDYRQLNKQLRDNALTEFNLAFSELLSAALEKLPSVQGTCYRTLRLNQTNLKNWIALANDNGTIRFDGYTSASEEMEIVLAKMDRGGKAKRNEQYVMIIIEGKTGKKIEAFSQFDGRHQPLPNQKEILFDKGCIFRFKEMELTDGNILIFKMTEV